VADTLENDLKQLQSQLRQKVAQFKELWPNSPLPTGPTNYPGPVSLE
jgi:hypothetical protein